MIETILLLPTATSASSPEVADDINVASKDRQSFMRRSLRDRETTNKLSPDFKGEEWFYEGNWLWLSKMNWKINLLRRWSLG